MRSKSGGSRGLFRAAAHVALACAVALGLAGGWAMAQSAQSSSALRGLAASPLGAATPAASVPSSKQASPANPLAASNGIQPSASIGLETSQQSPATLLQDQAGGSRPVPFGAELFSNSNVTASLNILDPGYLMQPGDHITLSEFGGLPDQVMDTVVDPKGNIFVPGVGPVPVQGLPAAAINKTVKTAASAVFSNAVQVYATPTTTAPITVFVTGPVVNPGPFSGASSDSVVAFLQRAGGIEAKRGSYRNITVRHDGQTIATIDLYAFLRTGEMQPVRLRQGDVIVVGQQGSIVSVYGSARAPYTFELSRPVGDGEELLYYARPNPETTYAGLLGIRGGKPFNTYLPITQFAHTQLLDGDRVQFSADAIADTLVVQVEGAHLGPSSYVVPRQTTLAALLAEIPLDPAADRRWIHLKRVSASITQKYLLNESLARLEKAIYTQSSSTEAVAQANEAQAQTIQQYINLAAQVHPEGDVALPPGADLSRVTLEPDDTVVIPYQSQVVSIGGEINEPQALIYQPRAGIDSYVRRAGGFTDIANRGHILVIHPDGTTQVGGQVLPGDRILVLTHLSGKFIELLKDLTVILYQTAIAGEAAARL